MGLFVLALHLKIKASSVIPIAANLTPVPRTSSRSHNAVDLTPNENAPPVNVRSSPLLPAKGGSQRAHLCRAWRPLRGDRSLLHPILSGLSRISGNSLHKPLTSKRVLHQTCSGLFRIHHSAPSCLRPDFSRPSCRSSGNHASHSAKRPRLPAQI